MNKEHLIDLDVRFWCNLCERFVEPTEKDFKLNTHGKTTRVMFSHHRNHLLTISSDGLLKQLTAPTQELPFTGAEWNSIIAGVEGLEARESSDFFKEHYKRLIEKLYKLSKLSKMAEEKNDR